MDEMFGGGGGREGCVELRPSTLSVVFFIFFMTHPLNVHVAIRGVDTRSIQQAESTPPPNVQQVSTAEAAKPDKHNHHPQQPHIRQSQSPVQAQLHAESHTAAPGGQQNTHHHSNHPQPHSQASGGGGVGAPASGKADSSSDRGAVGGGIGHAGDAPAAADTGDDEGLSPPDHFRNQRFKLIPRIVEGPFLVRNAVGAKPALLGQKLTQRYFRGENYVETDIHVGSNVIANNITGLSRNYSK